MTYLPSYRKRFPDFTVTLHTISLQKEIYPILEKKWGKNSNRKKINWKERSSVLLYHRFKIIDSIIVKKVTFFIGRGHTNYKWSDHLRRYFPLNQNCYKLNHTFKNLKVNFTLGILFISLCGANYRTAFTVFHDSIIPIIVPVFLHFLGKKIQIIVPF